MRKCLATIAIMSLTLSGCAASTEEMTAYYSQMAKQTQAIINSVEMQGIANRAQQAKEMQFFSNASVNAAKTASDADDTLVAFAWGYRMGQPMKIEIPDLPTIQAPITDVDRVRAWTPIVGMAVPFLYPLAYGWSNSSGSTYQATDNGRINVNSQNPGSYNTSGHDTITSTDPNNENCLDCAIDDPADVITDELCPGYPGAVESGGTLWIDSSQTCSCTSRAAGQC